MTDHNISHPSNEEPVCFTPTTIEPVPSQMGQLFLITLYSLTALMALLGNVTVIVVAMYGSETAQNMRMYLINLAVTDIIIGVLCLPFTYTDFMLSQWIFPHWLCPIAQYAQLLSVFVTSFTLSIIGVERYMATLHPFSNVHFWLESHTNLILIITWICGALYAAIPLQNTYTRPYTQNNSTYYECSYDNNLSLLKRHIIMYSNLILTFLLPLVVLICFYSAIMKKLLADQQSQTTRQTEPSPTLNNNNPNDNTPRSQECVNSANVQSNKNFQMRKSAPANHRSKTIKMLFTVMLLFGICWAPIKLFQFLLDFQFLTYCSETELYAFVCIYFVCHWSAMASSIVNPIVYSFMSDSFRNDFKKIIKMIRTSPAELNIMSMGPIGGRREQATRDGLDPAI